MFARGLPNSSRTLDARIIARPSEKVHPRMNRTRIQGYGYKLAIGFVLRSQAQERYPLDLISLPESLPVARVYSRYPRRIALTLITLSAGTILSMPVSAL